MKQATFVISEFTNPSGEIVFRVSGRLEGMRVRKNFPTREEARAEADALEIQKVQGETGIRPTVTRLTEDQLHECEAIVRRLTGKPHSLSFYVDFALANYREPATQKLLSDAVTEYEATKDHEREQDLLSEPHLVRLKRDLKRLLKHFPGATVAELTAPRLVEYFEARRAGHKTFNNRRGIVSTFLKFALQRGWLTDNPLVRVPQKRIRRRKGCAVTLSAADAKKVMEFVETTLLRPKRSTTEPRAIWLVSGRSSATRRRRSTPFCSARPARESRCTCAISSNRPPPTSTTRS